ncbi:MAG TPA: UbiA family prenyltransferase [Candidatus Dormibacteraeota bacterium]
MTPLKRLIGLIKASHPEPVAAVTLLATLLAIGAGRGTHYGLVILGAVLTGQLAVGWANDYMDADLDAAEGRLDKPVIVGEVGHITVGIAAVLALIACIPLSLEAGRAAAGAHFIAIGAALAYNAGLKKTPLSVIPYGVAFGMLPAFITLGPPINHFPSVWATLAGVLAGCAAHFAQSLPDIEKDRKFEIFGLPQMVGPQLSAVMAAVLFAGAATVVTVGAPSRPLYLALALVIVLMVAVVATAMLGRLKIAFQLTVISAVAMIVALVVGGGSF